MARLARTGPANISGRLPHRQGRVLPVLLLLLLLLLLQQVHPVPPLQDPRVKGHKAVRVLQISIISPDILVDRAFSIFNMGFMFSFLLAAAKPVGFGESSIAWKVSSKSLHSNSYFCNNFLHPQFFSGKYTLSCRTF